MGHRVTLGPNQAIDLISTLMNAREFCGMHGASAELMDWLAHCLRTVEKAERKAMKTPATGRP